MASKPSQNIRAVRAALRVLMSMSLAAILFTAQPSIAQTSGYWHTRGNRILDATNKVVRISGINWYGFEATDEVVHGLSDQDYRTILDTIQSLGYNVIRLPWSNQMVETPIVPSHISYSNKTGPINADLKGLNSLQIMDKIVVYAGTKNLRIILDNHRSEAGNSAEPNGLWYTSAYPQTAWLHDWQTMVTRYMHYKTADGQPVVIGVDLRNEPHNALSGGACWGCTATPLRNWPAAAQQAGNTILSIDPGLLIFVEGTDCFHNDCGWWGGNLEGAAQYPVVLNTPHRLVYSVHEYGPNLYAHPWFNGSTNYKSLVSVWTKFWDYLSQNGTAPVWVGEFGTGNAGVDIQNTAAGSQGQWFQSFVKFLQSRPQLNWTYWALNGEDNYGLLDKQYDSKPASARKQQMLSSIQFRK